MSDISTVSQLDHILRDVMQAAADALDMPTYDGVPKDDEDNELKFFTPGSGAWESAGLYVYLGPGGRVIPPITPSPVQGVRTGSSFVAQVSITIMVLRAITKPGGEGPVGGQQPQSIEAAAEDSFRLARDFEAIGVRLPDAITDGTVFRGMKVSPTITFQGPTVLNPAGGLCGVSITMLISAWATR